MRFLVIAVLLLSGCTAKQTPVIPSTKTIHEHYLGLTSGSSVSDEIFELLGNSWKLNHAPMALDALRFAQQERIALRLVDLLESKTGQQHGYDFNAWLKWLWQQDFEPHPQYADFKQKLYRGIDRQFANYFDDAAKTKIRLDEIRWGGVVQDGIPPLRQPKMIGRAEAEYLADTDVVFGIEVNGEARAYPKRILAWHEMFVDTIQGIELAGVY